MDASLKKILRGISLELRHTLEGWHDKKTGAWNPGDLERRLNEIGAWGDRPSKPLDEMPHLSAEDKAARRLVDGYLQLRAEAGVERAAAVAEFVRESAYTWANRLFALRCMEARSIIEEVILQKAAYAGRSLVHQRHIRKNPDAAKGEDDGLFAVLFAEFAVRSQELPALFDPKSPAVALRPSVAALKRCVALLSGTDTVRGQDPATDEVFAAPDAFGWAYQFWNADEKDRVFEMLRTKKGAKIQGADIIPATQLYTEPYMVKFLVQNSLGALWMGMYPDSKLCERWEYYVKDADRAPVTRKPVCEITFLDPAEGSGHFHLEAFDLFYAMYAEEAAREGRVITPREICAAILNHNLYGIDIDGRSVQIATAALWMKARERALELEATDLTSFHEHLVATNIRLPKERNHLELFLQKHPEDKDLRPALELVFQGLEHADELGALLQIEELVDAVLRRLKEEADKKKGTEVQPGLFEPTLVQGTLPVGTEAYDKWKRDALNRLQAHFESEARAGDAVQAFFAESASKGFSLLELFGRKYSVVAANPPYLSFRNVGEHIADFLRKTYGEAPTDTYSAFMVRALDIVEASGRVAFVTQDGLLLLPSIAGLRERMLTTMQIDCVAHLGPRAFEDISGEKVSVVLTILARTVPAVLPIWIRLVRQQDKNTTLKEAAQNGSHRIVNGLQQSEYLRTSKKQFLYFAPRNFIEVLAAGHTFASHAIVKQGIISWDNDRYIRYWWETPQLRIARWIPYFFSSEDIKLGASGLPLNAIDWRDAATWRFIRPRAEELRFRHGIAFGRLGKEFRVVPLPPSALFDVNASAGLFHSRQFESWLFGYLCAPLIAAVSKALNVSLTFLIQDVANIPVPPNVSAETKSELCDEAQQLIHLRSNEASLLLCAPNFICSTNDGLELLQRDNGNRSEAQCLAAVDQTVQRLLGLSDAEAEALRDLAEIAALEGEGEVGDESAENIQPKANDQPVPQVDSIGYLILRLLGHRWPKQIEAAKPVPAWVDQDGVIPLTTGGGETPLIDRVSERLTEDSPGGNVAAREREFEEIVGVSLEQWLAGPFFERHISQFKKRPIAWQLETVASRQAAVPGGKGKKKRAAAGKPVFACLVYYHKLDVDLLPKIRTQYVGLLLGGFETEFRTLERLANPTDDQQARRLQLEQWTDELQTFDRLLEDVSLRGFGPEALRPALRQYGINDALLSLTASWLRRLSETVAKGPLSDWVEAATKTELHPDLPKWLRDSMSHLNHFCAVLGPKPPDEKSLTTDPTSKELAPLVCHQANSMVESSLKLGCDRWWRPLDAAVLEPLRQEIKTAKAEIEKIDEELKAEGLPFQRRNELGERKHELKVKVKSIKADHDEKSDRARKVRSQIEKWVCPEAETWETWLSAQPLFDAVASLDGQRPPPQSIADFITQESRYAPDINDGVRVNIAPIQKAGLLHADVLDAKDADKAIADRAEWRADERRWVREGKLPQPGWWKTNNTEVAPDAKLKHIL